MRSEATFPRRLQLLRTAPCALVVFAQLVRCTRRFSFGLKPFFGGFACLSRSAPEGTSVQRLPRETLCSSARFGHPAGSRSRSFHRGSLPQNKSASSFDAGGLSNAKARARSASSLSRVYRRKKSQSLSLAASTNASKSASASACASASISGCHCTPKKKRFFGSSKASTIPSSLERAFRTSPSPKAFTH